MGALFGTDGIRGSANTYPMIPEVALNVGRSVAQYFCKNGSGKIVIGKDTRISGNMLEYAMVAGICSMGMDVHLAGVLPTPGVAFLTAALNADAGIMISASHNPYYDNGIKVFRSDGFKLSDEVENKLEQLILDPHLLEMTQTIKKLGTVSFLNSAANKYIEFLKDVLNDKNILSGLKIVLDCSNGATYQVAPKLFKELGANVETLFNEPNGININDKCGSQNPETLSKRVIESKADIGFAFDGDGDRLIVVDEKGCVLSGDQIIYICAKHLKEQGKLKNNRVVTTVMSNFGLGVALKELDVIHDMAQVGDRYVLELMQQKDAIIGGEDSGHMIFLDHHTTGDGILSALKLVEAICSEDKPLSELRHALKIYPQILKNVEVRQRTDINTIPSVSKAIAETQNALGEKGRVLVRYSGTRPLCRVMIEGPSREMIETYCDRIAEEIKQAIGK